MLTPSMPLPKDGICVLEIISVGSKPLALLLSQTMSPSLQAKLFMHFHTFKWEPVVIGLPGISEWVWVCYWQQVSRSLVKNTHLAVACTHLFTFISFESCRYTPFAGNIKGHQKSQQELVAGDSRFPALPEKQPCS